jgi:hypothetical protein
VGFPDRLRTTRDLRLLRSHRSWGPTPWRSLALTGLPYPASLTPVLWGCVPQPWSLSVMMLCLSYHPLLSLLLLVGSAVGTRYMYSVRSRYKMMKQKKQKKKESPGSRCHQPGSEYHFFLNFQLMPQFTLTNKYSVLRPGEDT